MPHREVIHSMTRRCRNWDYRRPGTYMVMISMADRSRDWLGNLVQEGDEWQIHPTRLGEAVVECWRKLGMTWDGVVPIALQLMPEHLHGILQVLTRQRHPLGHIIGSFKAKSTASARALGGDGVPPGVTAGDSLWCAGFQDSILWTDERFRKGLSYLLDNPRRLAIKRTHPELFRMARDIAVDLGAGRIGHFSAIGNHFLLSKYLAQVQISRRDFGYLRMRPRDGSAPEIVCDQNGVPRIAFQTAEYAVRKASYFTAANGGAVLLSPCISDGERQIAREALDAGMPLVTMHNKGFSRLQKPTGRYFDACADGRLLMLAPIAWPFQPGRKPMTRTDALAMNRLCQWLAGEGAADIHYSGMQPADIDGLAEAAAHARRMTGGGSGMGG